MSPPDRLAAVTFDFWGTLARDTPEGSAAARRARLAALAEIAARAGIPDAARAVEAAYERCGLEMERRFWALNRDCAIESQVGLFLDCIEDGLADRLARSDFEAAVDAYASPILTWPPTLSPGARRALEDLAARGLALAIISNTGRTPGRMLRRLLERFELLHHFGVVSYSDEVGVRKPDRAIFETALRALGVPAGAALHVGDSAAHDVAGARRAGLRAAHYVADGTQASAEADVIVEDLRELPDRLRSWLA